MKVHIPTKKRVYNYHYLIQIYSAAYCYSFVYYILYHFDLVSFYNENEFRDHKTQQYRMRAPCSHTGIPLLLLTIYKHSVLAVHMK